MTLVSFAPGFVLCVLQKGDDVVHNMAWGRGGMAFLGAVPGTALRRWGRCGGILALLAVLLAACGGGGGTGDGGNGFTSEMVAQQVQVAADPSGALRWDRAAYEATAGDISFVVKNASPVGHQFSIEGNGVNYKSANFGTNTTNILTVQGLPAGEYQIVCNYPGHKAAGMIAKLTVK